MLDIFILLTNLHVNACNSVIFTSLVNVLNAKLGNGRSTVSNRCEISNLLFTEYDDRYYMGKQEMKSIYKSAYTYTFDVGTKHYISTMVNFTGESEQIGRAHV